MDDLVILYTTWPDAETAEAFGRRAVEERLAACANVLGPMRSIYRWEGAIEEAQEIAALFKTTADAADPLIARLAALHSYDVPAAMVWPIETAHAPYVRWVAESVKGEGAPPRD